ncbi:hypothetical protein [Aneurinibacillus migulanus]|nr:hypothetical protein [Aneurinibacillus migulanus]MCP1358162.1 hypothetical protein [Aneurinibacillus migulanus]MED0894075.1 hypothetical protein [Aneurinibacillus migulanus]MED1616806.1 hypothetical protein [Aneurinibacillus migulanus]MED4729057.1 hypothetical protein [Aneurinibacillus migulanus]
MVTASTAAAIITVVPVAIQTLDIPTTDILITNVNVQAAPAADFSAAN